MDVGGARRRARLAIAAAVVVLAVVGFAAYELAGQATRPSPAAAQTPQTPQTPQVQQAPRTQPTPQVTETSSAPTATAVTPSGTANPPAGPLTPARAESFGPNGTTDGDNPELAQNILSNPAAGWRTQWYATAAFGQLKPGTGLLLDMGTTVTIASVTAQLGPQPGAVLELRVAQRPDPAAFRTLGTVTATSGTAALNGTAPAQARYVLLWCTRLPPNGTGTFELFVHRVTVEGHR